MGRYDNVILAMRKYFEDNQHEKMANKLAADYNTYKKIVGAKEGLLDRQLWDMMGYLEAGNTSSGGGRKYRKTHKNRK